MTDTGEVGTVVSPDAVATAVEVDGVGPLGPPPSVLPQILARLAVPGLRAWLLSLFKPSMRRWWSSSVELLMFSGQDESHCLLLVLRHMLYGHSSNFKVVAYEREGPPQHRQLIGIVLYPVLGGAQLGLGFVEVALDWGTDVALPMTNLQVPEPSGDLRGKLQKRRCAELSLVLALFSWSRAVSWDISRSRSWTSSRSRVTMIFPWDPFLSWHWAHSCTAWPFQ